MALLVASACAVASRARRLRRERRVLLAEPGVGSHELRAGFDLVTLPGAAVVAYSLGGRRPQVVLSQGLYARLGGEGAAAVVAHEAAHVRARHDRWLLLAALGEAALWFVPWARPATRPLRVSLECWADKEAAQQVGWETLHAALLGAAGIGPVPSSAAALSGADALAERLTMLIPGQREPAGRLAPVPALAAMAVAALSGAGGLGVALAVFHLLCGS